MPAKEMNAPQFNLGDLGGPDGNAYSILGRWRAAARQAGWTEAAIKGVMDDAMSGDYDHLVQTIKNNSQEE